MPSPIATALRMSPFVLASAVDDFLAFDTALPYTQLKTHALEKYFNYQGELQPAGEILASVAPLPEAILDIDVNGVDSLCTESRQGAEIPRNSCLIGIFDGNCTHGSHGEHVFSPDTILDPWRDGNYWNTSKSGTFHASQMLVRAGAGLPLASFNGKVVIVHDSAANAMACGPIDVGQINGSVDTKATITLAKVDGYNNAVDFKNGTVTLSSEEVNTVTLLAPTGLTGADPACNVNYSGKELNGCGIQIYEGKDCGLDAGSNYWDGRAGSADPWKHVQYKDTEVRPKQPVYTGFTLEQLKQHTVIVHNSTGSRIACGVLQPFGAVPPTTTTTTTTKEAASSSIPWWGILLMALGALALLGGIAAAFLCGGSKKRSMKKKSSKKRAMAEPAPVEPAPAPQPQPQGSVVYYTTSVAQPMTYAAPIQTVAQPVVTYAAPVQTQAYATPVATYAAPGQSTFDMIDRNHDGVITQAEFAAAMGQQAAAPVYAQAVPTYAAPQQYVPGM